MTDTTNISPEMRGAIGGLLSRQVSFPISDSDIRKWAIAVAVVAAFVAPTRHNRLPIMRGPISSVKFTRLRIVRFDWIATGGR